MMLHHMLYIHVEPCVGPVAGMYYVADWCFYQHCINHVCSFVALTSCFTAPLERLE